MTSSLHKQTVHDSAVLHVTGAARYIDDLPVPAECLVIVPGLSPVAHGRIQRLDLTGVAAAPGVVRVLTAADIPGRNDVSPVFGDDPAFAEDRVLYHGQIIYAVVATSIRAARAAMRAAVLEIEELPAILTIEEALAQDSLLGRPWQIEAGNPQAELAASPHQIEGQIEIGGQEHFYLEGQAALAMPGEEDQLTIFVSSQHPTEIQHKVADLLGVPNHSITVEVRRMGGGFGGKESQANQPACIAALAARLTGRPAKLVYDRDDDMRITGKRHDFLIRYQAGFDDEGRIRAVIFDQALRCGMSFDLSKAIAERAALHADNGYAIPNMQVTARLCQTHTPSNTAFRGFGGPQGMLGIEAVIDRIAHQLGRDPLAVRQANFYPDHDSPAHDKAAPASTHYGQPVTDGVLNRLTDQLAKSSDYHTRRQEIADWNSQHQMVKRGLALTPVKFGISFNKTFLNQGGALVHVYTDGSVHLNHGGTEMGQGLHTKVRQIVAHVFGLPDAMVRVSATSTGKVPNTSATAASSGTDLNGMAAFRAAETIRARMADYLAGQWQQPADSVRFADGKVHIGPEEMDFARAASLCWQGRVSLSSTGYYATPDIHWDAETGKGQPFYYFAYGAAVSEVVLDLYTGESRMLRTDILHDAGQSINPAIDRGQIEGGFIQGAGWLTCEELVYGKDGRLLTHAPSTYKIPACSDRPLDLRVELLASEGNLSATIHRSKAVGEPPFMLGMSVFFALSDALAAAGPGYPGLDAPATAERLLNAAMRNR